MTYWENTWTCDEAHGLQRGKPAKRGVGSNTWSSKSQPMGDKMSEDVLKHGGEVRSITKSVSGSDQKIMFQL